MVNIISFFGTKIQERLVLFGVVYAFLRYGSGVNLELLIGVYLLAGTCCFGAVMYLWRVVVPVSTG